MLTPMQKRTQALGKGGAGVKAESLAKKRLKADPVPFSGALAGAKGDYKVGEFLVENKTSTNDSFSVKKDHLYKVYQEALELGKTPALAFQFINSQGQSAKRDRWVCIPESMFSRLIEFLEEECP